ncbi:MAG: hypothetical protein HQL75_02355 [Magnetococcales bacterium]|nr:hypothetical protein [Magnetococcales bacterium]
MQKIAAATGDDSLHPKYLDRHKLGACVAGAFLHKGVFQRVQSITGDEWSKYAFFSNEILAFQCAINTLIAFLRVIVKKNPNSIDATRLEILENFGFSYPPSQEDGWGYEFHIFRALRQCHIQRHCLPSLPTGGPRPPFDLFLFSTILFDIERHNLAPLTANNVQSTSTNLAA